MMMTFSAYCASIYKLITVILVVLVSTHAEVLEDEPRLALEYDTATFHKEVSRIPHFVKFYAPWCGHCKRVAPIWDELAEEFNYEPKTEILIAKVDCTVETALCSDQGVTGYPTLKLFKTAEDAVRFRGERSLELLKTFIQETLHPESVEKKVDDPEDAATESGLYDLSDNTFNSHVEKGMHFIKFYAPWCGHCQRLAPTWEALANAYSSEDEVKIAKVDCTKHKSVCQQAEIKGYPSLMWYKDGQMIAKYQGSRTLEDLQEYVEKMRMQKAEESGSEQGKIPDSKPAATQIPSSSSVKKLRLGDFQSETETGTTFVMFFAPWCGHCKRLAPTWEDLASKFSAMESVKIAKVDCTDEKELCEEWEIRGYPTLNLYQKGAKVETYKGDRELESLYKYVRDRLPKDEL